MVRKKLVLNACGVKSLGGVKLFVQAFELLVEAGTEITVLYSENEFYNELKNQSLENQYVTFIKLTNKRFLHPFLYLITNKTQRKLIESNDAIVHFGNFGFKTNNKSFVLIQNILPFVSKDLKNIVLRKFISGVLILKSSKILLDIFLSKCCPVCINKTFFPCSSNFFKSGEALTKFGLVPTTKAISYLLVTTL